MKASSDFSYIAPDETVILSMDFSAYLAAGDAIASVSAWNCSVASYSTATDNAPADRLSGAATKSGTVVQQKVTGCLADVLYLMEAVVVTVGGETLSLWAHLLCREVGK
jgi:hypothetical protein